jgi:uncharacterized cupin superfamily protein
MSRRHRPDAAAMTALKLPAVDPASLPPVEQTGYPEGLRERVKGRARRRLGDACGLKQFGVNLTTLQPGTHSALRHWHTLEDEFIYVVSGELVLVTDGGEQLLRPGQCAGFPAGVRDGHCLVNRSSAPAQYLEVGSRVPGDTAGYPDDDLALVVTPEGERFCHRDGRPY